MNVVNAKVSLYIGGFFLREMIVNGMRDLDRQKFRVDAFVLGTIEIVVRDIIVRRLKIEEGRILSELEVSLELIPDSSLLPAFEGVIVLSSSIGIKLQTEETDVDFELGAFFWLMGPTALRSRRNLSLVKGVTTLVAKYAKVIERSIEQRAAALFSPEEIGRLLSGLPAYTSFEDLIVSMVGLHIHLEEVLISKDSLEINLHLDADYIVAKEKLNLGYDKSIVLGRSAEKESRIFVSESELNFLLSSKLSLINKQLESSPVKIAKVELQLDSGLLVVSITPQGMMSKPIICRMWISTGSHHDLILDDLEITSDPNSSIFVKALLRLVSGKVESEIERYFPLSFTKIVTPVLTQLDKMKDANTGSHLVSVKAFEIIGIEVLERQVMIRTTGQIELTRK